MPIHPPPAPLQLEPVGAAFRLVMTRNALESPLTPRLASKAEFLESFDLRDDEISEIFSTSYEGDRKTSSHLDSDEDIVLALRHQLFIQTPSSSTTDLSTSSSEVLTMVTTPASRDSSLDSNASSPSLRSISFDCIFSPPSPLLIIETERSGPILNTTLIEPNSLQHLAELQSPNTNTQESVHSDAIGTEIIESQPISCGMNSENYAISPPVRIFAEINKTLPHLPSNPADMPTNHSSNLNPKHFDHSASLKQNYEDYKTSNPPTPGDISDTPKVIKRKKSQVRLSQPDFSSSIYFNTAKSNTLTPINLDRSPTSSANRASFIFRATLSKPFKSTIHSPSDSSSSTSKMPEPFLSPSPSPTLSPTPKRTAIARMFFLNRTKNQDREKSITKAMIPGPSKLFSSLRSASSSSSPYPVPNMETGSVTSTHTPAVCAPHLQLSEESLGDWKEPLLEFFPEDEQDSSSCYSSIDESCVTPNDNTTTTITQPLKETQFFAHVTTSPTSEPVTVSSRFEALESVYNHCYRKVKTLRQELEKAKNSEKEKNTAAIKESIRQHHRSIQEIELELAAAEKERYESGLLLNRAYQRQREYGGTDFWVRSVGIA